MLIELTGIPACVCYYKSGIMNDFNMRYLDTKLKKNLKKCLWIVVYKGRWYVITIMFQVIYLETRGTKKIKKHFLRK